MRLRFELKPGEMTGIAPASERELKQVRFETRGPDLPDRRLIISGVDVNGTTVKLFLDEEATVRAISFLEEGKDLADLR